MGIQNLLPNLKSIMDPKHISEYAGKKVGIDAYAWLHRSAYTCAQELCLGEPTNKWLEWCIARCRLLLHHKVEPVLVFDGGRLPEKDKTERGRRESRESNRQKAMSLLNGGDRNGAFKMFQKSIDITPAMANTLQNELKKNKIEFITAPYEADAQLAYLNKTGYIVSVITEDSDLLVFGCSRVFYKMDGEGAGSEIRLKNLDANVDLKFQGWTHEMFQQMCIFAGCDYLASLPNVGIKKAHSYMAQNKSWDRAIRRIRLDGRTPVPSTYDREFELAFLTFKHQRVYDPITKKLVHLTPIDEEFTRKFADTSFLGAELPDDIACGIAEGRLDPETHQPYPTPTPTIQRTTTTTAAAAAATVTARTTSTPITSYLSSTPSAAARVPSIQTVMNGPSRPSSTSSAVTARPTISGWSKKHSTNDHHFQPAAAPMERAKRYGQYASTTSTIFAASVQANHHQTLSATSFSLTQQKVLDTCGALIENSSDIAHATIPAALKQDFRPPRLRDITNTYSSTQPTPSKSASNLHIRTPPSTAPSKSSSQAERARILDGYTGRTNTDDWRHQSTYVNTVGEVDADDDIGFSNEDVEAQLEMEAEEEKEEMDIEEEKQSYSVALPLQRKLKTNFLSRSSTGITLPLRPHLSSSAPSPPPRPRTSLPPPSSAAPLTFFSPPGVISPSPPPPLPAVSNGPMQSKYFARRPNMKSSHTTTSSLGDSYLPPALQVPNASSFLFAPPSIPTPTFASLNDVENDASSTDMDIPDDLDEHPAQSSSSSSALRRHSGVKRSASGQSAESDLKRFRSLLVNSSGRLTLQVSHQPTSTSEESSLYFHPIRTTDVTASQEPDVGMTPSPEPDTSSPDPITTALTRTQTNQPVQPFQRLTVQPRSPRTQAAAAAASSSNYLTLPSHRRMLQTYEGYGLGYSSPPFDAAYTPTPPSPTPSPDSRVADPSPSPSSAATLSPEPPPLSQPFAAPCAVAGFSSQPSEAEEDEEEIFRQEEANIIVLENQIDDQPNQMMNVVFESTTDTPPQMPLFDSLLPTTVSS